MRDYSSSGIFSLIFTDIRSCKVVGVSYNEPRRFKVNGSKVKVTVIIIKFVLCRAEPMKHSVGVYLQQWPHNVLPNGTTP